MRNGVRRAYVTVLDAAYLKIHVPGVKASSIAFLYFPSLS
jgi:hypothetical protein